MSDFSNVIHGCRKARRVYAALGWLLSAAVAWAQPQTVLPAPRPGSQPNVVLVPADRARVGTLSETHGLLAFAHDGADALGRLSLVKLDARGQPSAASTSWKLPPQKGLEKSGQFASGLAFHPKLPLLYIWQDTNLTYSVPTNYNLPAVQALPNLLVYRVDRETPELVVALRPSPGALLNMQGGAVAVDPGGEFLVVPNIRDKGGFMRGGRYRLDADGLPKRDGDKAAEPAQLTPVEYVYTFPMNPWGCVHSVHFLERDVMLLGSIRGLFCWRPGDPVVEGHHLPLPAQSHTQFCRHPKLPLVYASRADTDSLYRVEHIDGYLTMLPHQVTIPGAKLFSAPAVLEGGKKLAVGGHYHLYFLDLDEHGRPGPGVVQTPVLNPMTRVLLHSPKFDRLYVAVEVSR